VRMTGASRLERNLLFAGGGNEDAEAVLFSASKSDEVAWEAMLFLIESRAGPYAQLADLDPDSERGSIVAQETFRAIRGGRVERAFR